MEMAGELKPIGPYFKGQVVGYVEQIGFDGAPIDFRTPRIWAALQARPSKEQDAADWLKRANLFAYWPCYVDQVRHSHARGHGHGWRYGRFRPVIPGYLFIAGREGSHADPSSVIRQTPGVIGYMRDASGHPAFLGNDDIEIIRHIEAGMNLPLDPKTAHKFRVGDKVRFCDDLLGRWPPGVVERLADNGRLSIGVAMLGRIVSVIAHPHQIEAM